MGINKWLFSIAAAPNVRKIAQSYVNSYNQMRQYSTDLEEQSILRAVMMKKISELQLLGVYSTTKFVGFAQSDFDKLLAPNLSLFIFKMMYFESEGFRKGVSSSANLMGTIEIIMDEVKKGVATANLENSMPNMVVSYIKDFVRLQSW